MPKKGRGNKSRPTAAATAGNLSDPSRSMTADAPEILTPTPCPDPPPDDQQPLDTAAVTVIGSLVFPDVASSSAFPDVVGSPAIPVAAASSGVPVVSDYFPAPPTTSRKGPGKRKKSFAVKKLAAIQEKLDFLSQNFRPVPFAPGRAPGLGRHERLFRILGLWDFAHLNLAADPLRPDLLSDLIAHYTPPSRSSTVCEFRINVSRADLARALSLPVKKTTPVEDELTLFKTEEASAVLTGFIQDWILVLEDTCVVPPEVVLATDTVKEGHAFKVDWAGLVWTMVEKELQEATKSGQCLYASHLQRLIKHQRPELFKEEGGTVLLQAVTDGNVSYSIPQHSVGQSSSDFLATGTGTHKNIASGSGPASPFSFGKRDINEMDDGDEVHQFSQINPQKRIRSEGQWGGNHGTTSSFTADFEQTQLWANKIKMNYSETERALANTQMQLQYVNDMLQQKDQMIHSLEKARMEEAQKRELEACRFEHDLRLLSQKRELEACRFERELEACRFEHDLRLLSQKRELEACRFEHELRLLSQKRELEACLFEHELRLLSRVVSGRKSALVETRNVFAEYRNKFSQGKEPLYKDVEGGGGLVLSTGEIERLEQLKKKEEAEVKSFEEEKERRCAEEMITEFAKGWNLKFTEYDQLIANLATKLMKHKEDFLLIKESYASAKLLEAKSEED